MSVVPKGQRLPYAALVNQVLAGISDVITFDSQRGKREYGLAGIMNRPLLKVIHNGADLQMFEPSRFQAVIPDFRRSMGIEENLFILGNIARLTEQKGQEVLLQAVSLLIRQGRNLKVVLVGGGPRRGELESLVDRLGINDHVLFLGPRHDLPELLSLFDILVLSSHWESLPVIILEAMAMAKPVVATDVAGVCEVVEDEVTGLLVEPNKPQLLAQAILKLMDNPGLAAQMGIAGRQRVERDFSVERMVAETTALYDDLLRQKGICL
jgi:glycosyltransferase involved in cell wall biosynthesis